MITKLKFLALDPMGRSEPDSDAPTSSLGSPAEPSSEEEPEFDIVLKICGGNSSKSQRAPLSGHAEKQRDVNLLCLAKLRMHVHI